MVLLRFKPAAPLYGQEDIVVVSDAVETGELRNHRPFVNNCLTPGQRLT